MRTTKPILLILGTALALAALMLNLGCTDAVTNPEAEQGFSNEGPTPWPKLRHAHLLDTGDSAGKVMERFEELMASEDFILGINDAVLEINRVFERYDNEDGVSVKHTYRKVYKGFAMHVDSARVADLLDLIEHDDDIEWIEPDPKVRHKPGKKIKQTGPRSQILPWGIDRIGGPTSAAQSGNGAGRVAVDLYVMDTGVKDKDIDVVEDLSFVGGNTRDDIGHGTHVAGTAAAEDDGDGAVGIAPGARVHNLKVLNGNGNTELSTVIAAVEYVTEQKADHPSTPMVVNMSFGADVGTADYNALDEAIASSIAQGVVYVIAAGNDAIDAATVTPAHVEEAITVGAYDDDDAFCDFSNYGAVVDLLAPGLDVLSIDKHPSPRFFQRMSGTSMAAPHVAGAAALYLSQHPSATPQEVRDALVATGQPWVTDAPAGTTNLSVWVGIDPPSGGNGNGNGGGNGNGNGGGNGH